MYIKFVYIFKLILLKCIPSMNFVCERFNPQAGVVLRTIAVEFRLKVSLHQIKSHWRP